MDTNQNQEQEDYESLKEVETIDERILNTPAEEQERLTPDINENQQMDTFMKFNQTPQVTTDEGIVLDLGGQKSKIDNEDLTEGASTKLLRSITGNELHADEFIKPGAFIIILLISIGLFGFLLVNFKRSEEISKLQKEIDKLKKFSLSDKD